MGGGTDLPSGLPAGLTRTIFNSVCIISANAADPLSRIQVANTIRPVSEVLYVPTEKQPERDVVTPFLLQVND